MSSLQPICSKADSMVGRRISHSFLCPRLCRQSTGVCCFVIKVRFDMNVDVPTGFGIMGLHKTGTLCFCYCKTPHISPQPLIDDWFAWSGIRTVETSHLDAVSLIRDAYDTGSRTTEAMNMPLQNTDSAHFCGKPDTTFLTPSPFSMFSSNSPVCAFPSCCSIASPASR